VLFNSLKFLIFFPIVTFVYFLIPQKIKYLWLLVASYYFYMCWNPEYAILIAISTIITYLSGIFISKNITASGKKWLVAGSFIINLAILFFFKYFYFSVDNINAIRALLELPKITPKIDVILPVGISFYTFQALSYTVDVYRGDIKPETNIFRYALFVSFFPQLVAGPIERSKNLLKQVNEKHYFDYERVRSGLLLMLWGFFLKLVIADRAAILVNAVYNDIYRFDGGKIALATVLFAVQIYCDFASYSTIARGAARVMGFELMQNFNRPYFSTSIADFWRNWHISLSSWFKDYLYIPLGGNRKGQIRKYFNLMVVFLVSGLWHGASWHFVVWGAIHGAFQIIGDATKKMRLSIRKALKLKENPLHKAFQILFVFAEVCFAWIFFRSNTMAEANFAVRAIFTNIKTGSLKDFLGLGLDLVNIYTLVGAILVLFLVSIWSSKKQVIEQIESKNLFIRWPIYLVLLFAVLIFGIYGPEFSASQFIYFQF